VVGTLSAIRKTGSRRLLEGSIRSNPAQGNWILLLSLSLGIVDLSLASRNVGKRGKKWKEKCKYIVSEQMPDLGRPRRGHFPRNWSSGRIRLSA
jgi:hypothetical protein